ncbi:MAG: carboxylating nicotinate-nucleotide diphosphorylase [Myxococcaceae bacterium]
MAPGARPDFVDRLLDLAFDEDLGASGDVTTRALVSPSALGRAELWAKEPMILSGLMAFRRAFQRFDPRVKVSFLAKAGQSAGPRSLVARVEGRLRSLLIAERTALNLVQRTCGIATLAHQAAQAVKGSNTRVLDTRKTPPGMRGLAKRAVRDGGAMSHRFGLFDGVLIKDNHIAAVGGITEALRRAKERAPHLLRIEIEVTDLAGLDEALRGGADVVMLDNMSDEDIKRAVKLTARRAKLEVSGQVTLERLPRLAKLGVDYVSMGALTHSARAMDLSLEIVQGVKRAKRRATSRGRR